MGVTEPQLRIGELSRRTGVSPSVLRAWEHRYALIRPARTSGGLRLFSAADEQRVLSMRAHMRSGLSAAEAARAVLASDIRREHETDQGRPEAGAASELDSAAAALADGLARLDRARTDDAIDRLFAAATFETVATDVLIPYLAAVGARWQRGESAIAEEHFATQVLRGRLLSLARASAPALGPRAVLACPPGEMHDIALVILGVALERCGWRVTLLGADTPIATVREAAHTLEADCVVLATTSEQRLADVASELLRLGPECRLLLAGPGSTISIAARVGGLLLRGDPIAAARELTAASSEEHAGHGDADW